MSDVLGIFIGLAIIFGVFCIMLLLVGLVGRYLDKPADKRERRK